MIKEKIFKYKKILKLEFSYIKLEFSYMSFLFIMLNPNILWKNKMLEVNPKLRRMFKLNYLFIYSPQSKYTFFFFYFY